MPTPALCIHIKALFKNRSSHLRIPPLPIQKEKKSISPLPPDGFLQTSFLYPLTQLSRWDADASLFCLLETTNRGKGMRQDFAPTVAHLQKHPCFWRLCSASCLTRSCPAGWFFFFLYRQRLYCLELSRPSFSLFHLLYHLQILRKIMWPAIFKKWRCFCYSPLRFNFIHHRPLEFFCLSCIIVHNYSFF